jgi:hypothetical protein
MEGTHPIGQPSARGRTGQSGRLDASLPRRRLMCRFAVMRTHIHVPSYRAGRPGGRAGNPADRHRRRPGRALVRQLAGAAAEAEDQTEWHLSLTDSGGRMTCHGCPPPKRRTNRDRTDTGRVGVRLPGRQERAFALYPLRSLCIPGGQQKGCCASGGTWARTCRAAGRAVRSSLEAGGAAPYPSRGASPGRWRAAPDMSQMMPLRVRG